MSSLTRIITIVGSLLLFYAGYLIRSHKREIDHDSGALKFQALGLLSLGFLLILGSQVLGVKLKHIRVGADIRTKSYEEVMTSNDYSTFNHRGRQFSKRLSTKK